MMQSTSDAGKDGSTFSVVIRPHVAYENFDDEVIVLNLNIGLYHALNETAGFIWMKIADQDPPESIAQEVARAFNTSSDVAQSMVAGFIGEIEEEQLVDVNGGRPPWAAQPSGQIVEAGPSPSWPVMTTYRDMRHALVLDPIHEVDESGWPRVKGEKPPTGAD